MPADVPTAALVGAGLWVLWGILHVYVLFHGLLVVSSQGVTGALEMLTGGIIVPKAIPPADERSSFAIGQLFKNFVIDVGGYGVLGFFVAYGIIDYQTPWIWYVVGVVTIGLADLAFLFQMVTSGVIKADAKTVGGPIVYFAAITVTPLGLPSGGLISPVAMSVVAGVTAVLLMALGKMQFSGLRNTTAQL